MSVYAHSAVAEYAIAEFPASLDQSVPDPLSALLANPRAKRTYLLEGSPLDGNGAEVDVRWSNDGYATFPADTPANQLYRALLEAPYNAQVSILRADGRPGGGSTPTFGDVTAINTSRRSAGAIVHDLDAHLGYSWAGRPLTIKVGAPGFRYSEFGPIFSGTAAGVRADDMEALSLSLRDYSYKLQKPIQTELFGGFGYCARGDGVDDYLSGTINCPAGSMTLECRARFLGLTGGTTRAIANWRNGLLAGERRLTLLSPGDVMRALVRNDAGTAFAADAGSSPTVGAVYHLALVLDVSALKVRLIIDGELASEATVSGTFNTVLSAFALLKLADGASNYFQGEVDDLRIWSIARATADIKATMGKELLGTETGLVYYNKINDGSGATATATLGNNLTLTGATWVGSLEGGQDIAGKPKPLGWGHIRQAQPVVVDSGNLIYQFATGPSQAVDAMEDQGVSLTPAGDVSDLYATTVTAGQYKTELARSYFRLGAKPTGTLTLDFRGDSSGTGYVSTVPDIIQRVVVDRGGLVVGDLDAGAFAAVEAQNSAIAGYWADTEGQSIDAALTALMDSVNGWWTYTRAGKLTMGIVTAPSLPSFFLDENDILVGAIERQTPPQPIYRWRVGYRHNWLTQDSDALAGSLSEEEKSLRAQGWRYATREDTSILTRYPEAAEITLDTHLDTLPAAQALADSLLVTYSEERATYKLPLVNGLFVYSIGVTIRVTVDRYDLSSGKDLLITGFVEDVANQELVLEAWG